MHLGAKKARRIHGTERYFQVRMKTRLLSLDALRRAVSLRRACALPPASPSGATPLRRDGRFFIPLTAEPGSLGGDNTINLLSKKQEHHCVKTRFFHQCCNHNGKSKQGVTPKTLGTARWNVWTKVWFSTWDRKV